MKLSYAYIQEDAFLDHKFYSLVMQFDLGGVSETFQRGIDSAEIIVRLQMMVRNLERLEAMAKEKR